MKNNSKSYAQSINNSSRLGSKGFSLIEMIIGLMILGLIAIASHDILKTSATRLKKLHELNDNETEGRTALALMKKDLRCAYLSSDLPNTIFVGRKDGTTRLDFIRTGQ